MNISPNIFELFKSMTAEQFVDITRVGLHNHIPQGLSHAKNPTPGAVWAEGIS